MKVLGVGLQKTGTTTLGVCLREFGFRHQSYSVRAAQMYAHGSLSDLLLWADRFESFDDVPWALMYREFDQRYPGSRFILTRRRSEALWFDSLAKHMHRMGPKSATLEMNEAIYGRPDPQNDRDVAIGVYQAHLQSVRDYFRDRPGDMIELCWEAGDGWRELAEFLERPAPHCRFPHANRAPGLRERWQQRWKARSRRRSRLGRVADDE